MRILLSDDEIEIRKVLRLLLTECGHEILEASDGEMAVRLAHENSDIDLCIMDIMMPKMSGIEATAEIRRFSDVPILFLTAKSLNRDKASAYESGGDDYLVKPFSPQELILKVDALTRRYNHYSHKEPEADTVKIGHGILINTAHREVLRNGEPVDIRDKEYEVLLYLVKNRGKTVSAKDIYESVWEEISLPSSNNTVTVHILNLRRKLEENPSSPKLIRTVWGKGYQIEA
ncbi:MAG: response regulator transcription factor [Clostridia bacterium]|nr:response regulator transcription factor [Clostridia bacterium]